MMRRLLLCLCLAWYFLVTAPQVREVGPFATVDQCAKAQAAVPSAIGVIVSRCYERTGS